MLPEKVRSAVRNLLIARVKRIVRLLNDSTTPDNVVAYEAALIGEAGAMLDPDVLAARWIDRQETEARRHARVCVWDGECEADATTDDGLCAAHAAEQTRQDADVQAEIDVDIARLVAEQGGSS